MWFVAKVFSMPSSDNSNSGKTTPALFLQNNKLNNDNLKSNNWPSYCQSKAFFWNKTYCGTQFYFKTPGPWRSHKLMQVQQSKQLDCWMKMITHISMFRGRFWALKSPANLRTDAREPKSRCMTSRVALGSSSRNLSLVSSPAFVLRTAIITCAPLFANTLAVSFPIPLVAPVVQFFWYSFRFIDLIYIILNAQPINNGDLTSEFKWKDFKFL